MSKTVFRVEIELGNDAMKTTADIKKALRNVCKRLEVIADGGVERLVLDVNGNRAGKVGFYLK